MSEEDKTTDAEPLPCPFCGSAETRPYPDENNPKWGAISCSNCGAIGPDVRTGYRPAADWRDDAVREWNRRAGATERPRGGAVGV